MIENCRVDDCQKRILVAELAEWKQAASVEAGLRREYVGKTAALIEVLQAVNAMDDHGFRVASMSAALRKRVEDALVAVGALPND